MAHVYIITNNITNKKYVGQTVGLRARLNQHKNCHGKNLLHEDIKVLGWDKFSVEVIDLQEKDLDKKEKQLIVELNTIFPNGYNLTMGGSNGRRSKITKQRMSEGTTIMLKKQTPEQKLKRKMNKSRAMKEFYLNLSSSQKQAYVRKISNITQEQRRLRCEKATKTFWSKSVEQRNLIRQKQSLGIKQAHALRTVEQKQQIALNISQAKKGQKYKQQALKPQEQGT